MSAECEKAQAQSCLADAQIAWPGFAGLKPQIEGQPKQIWSRNSPSRAWTVTWEQNLTFSPMIHRRFSFHFHLFLRELMQIDQADLHQNCSCLITSGEFKNPHLSLKFCTFKAALAPCPSILDNPASPPPTT